MITFETEEEFRNAVLKVIKSSLSVHIDNSYSYGGPVITVSLGIDGVEISSSRS